MLPFSGPAPFPFPLSTSRCPQPSLPGPSARSTVVSMEEDGEPCCPLAEAIQAASLSIVRVLLDHGASVVRQSVGALKGALKGVRAGLLVCFRKWHGDE